MLLEENQWFKLFWLDFYVKLGRMKYTAASTNGVLYLDPNLLHRIFFEVKMHLVYGNKELFPSQRKSPSKSYHL